MGSCFFVIYCHGLESRSSPAVPVRFVMMFLLMLTTVALQWLHNFSAVAQPKADMITSHCGLCKCLQSWQWDFNRGA